LKSNRKVVFFSYMFERVKDANEPRWQTLDIRRVGALVRHMEDKAMLNIWFGIGAGGMGVESFNQFENHNTVAGIALGAIAFGAAGIAILDTWRGGDISPVPHMRPTDYCGLTELETEFLQATDEQQ
jgi:hypothetical protein